MLPTIVARCIPPSTTIEAFLVIPSYLRLLLSYLALDIAQRAAKRYAIHKDKKKFGPDVVAVPKLKTRWPGNLDFMKSCIEAQENDYCTTFYGPLLEKYGNTVELGIVGATEVLTSEPEIIKAILSTDFGSFEKGSHFKDPMYTVLGKGIFNSDGDLWKFHRTMSRPYFSRDRISHFDNFARHSDMAISKILARLAEPSRPPVDFQDIVGRFTLDSGTEFLFGKDIQSLNAPLPYPHITPTDTSASFAAAFGRAQEMMVVRSGFGLLWPLFEMFWDRTEDDMRVIDAYVLPILREKLAEKKNIALMPKGDKVEEGNDTLLDHLVQFTDGESIHTRNVTYTDKILDETTIKDETINILVAGRDTTAATLTFVVYLLATHPNVMRKLRDEILATVEPMEYPTPDSFRDMKYLRAVINETLRLFPAVPINERSAAKSTVIKSGTKSYYIAKGTTRKDLWGPDAEEFDPERWLDDRLKKYLTPNPFIFLPFNAGPRICLGQQFAYNEVSFFLVRLLQRVDAIELAPEAHPEGTLPPEEWKSGVGRKAFEKVWPKSHLTIYSKGGMWVRMKEAALLA
ncbi:cytochrome P450 family protein [Ceratobasidium sp. AG-Ba]|nr:cytochrome P450 family protein [Ceratobasidium sp. AG-Ba]